MQEREGGAGAVFEILRQPTAAAEPTERSFNDPPLREHLEAARLIGALDDLDLPVTERPHRGGRSGTLVRAVGGDARDERERPARLFEQRQGAITILDVGRVNVGRQDQAERVDQDMTLLPFDLLARVIARRVDASAPFSALLTL